MPHAVQKQTKRYYLTIQLINERKLITLNQEFIKKHKLGYTVFKRNFERIAFT